MCGIAGFLNLNSSNFNVDENLLQKMQQALSHRGPDDFGIWANQENQIGFAHRRLSIVDLSPQAAQPMLDKQNSVAIVFNGEIYNHLELRKELQNLGYQYFSKSDTESIIYAYKQWGIDFIHKLDGEFAIALFDLQKKKFYLIRDRIGVKPVYFSFQNNICSFASEIKALLCLPWMQKNFNYKAFYHYLTFMITPAPYTIFDQIYKLPAGFYLKIDCSKKINFCDINFTEWYSPLKKLSLSEQKEFEKESFCLENIENLLKDATKKRMMSDVPFGAFLSGGVDSSLNVALMSEYITNVKTFTVSFSDGPEFDELKYARRVSKIFNTDHHEIIISEKEAFEFYQKMIYHLDEPLADCVCIPFYFVSKLAKDSGVSVAQVGEGADELFLGYKTYQKYKNFYNKYWWPTQKITPDILKKSLYKISSLFIRQNLNYLELAKNWAYNRNLFWGGAIAFFENQKNIFLNKNFDIKILQTSIEDAVVNKILGQNFGLDSFDIVNYYSCKLKKFDKDADFLKQLTYLELKQRLPELLLMRADKMSMAVGVEGRVPFLDYKLVEFMLNVPSKIKFKNNQTKYLLKKISEKYLPKDIIYRKKVGFAAPIVRWYKSGKYFPDYFKKQVSGLNYFENDYKTSESVLAVQKWALQNFYVFKNNIKNNF
ncbi:MAG: asparagine synthase (glutamine-hydrolyzing) [Candidatus Babeliales bacterium]